MKRITLLVMVVAAMFVGSAVPVHGAPDRVPQQPSQSEPSGSSSPDGMVGAAPAAEMASPVGATLLTFSEYPVGTSIVDQYVNRGVRFGGDSPYITTDGAHPTSPVLSGTPRFTGSIEWTFMAKGKPAPASYVAFDAGYFNAWGSTMVTLYGVSGQVLDSVANPVLGIHRFVFDHGQTADIARVRVDIVWYEPAGYSIDNLEFVVGPRALRIVALGDSYISGEGAGAYGFGGGNVACHRSSNAYPVRVRQKLLALGMKVDLQFKACSGAEIEDVLHREQRRGEANPAKPGQPGQIGWLNGQEDLVIISVGGNDIGFTSTLIDCAISNSCVLQHLDTRIARLYSELTGLIASVRVASPRATVVVVGYPQIFAVPGVGKTNCLLAAGLSRNEISRLRDQFSRLNDVTKAATQRMGALFADPEFNRQGKERHIFAGKYICSSQPRAHNIKPSSIKESFHPNRVGHRRELTDLVFDAAFTPSGKLRPRQPTRPDLFQCNGLFPTMVGSRLGDTLTGTTGTDVIVGRGGGDVIRGSYGNDVICGDDGRDQILGGPGDDTILGNAGNDIIKGGDGIDVLRGGAGVDTVNGGPGFDLLFGGPGNDQLHGGKGDDFLNGEAGNDTLWGGVGADILHGSSGADILRGENGADRLWGGGGGDALYGGPGPDELRGGEGRDSLFASGGNDKLWGNAGNDILNGGAGRDVCDGGPGTDTAAACEVRARIP